MPEPTMPVLFELALDQQVTDQDSYETAAALLRGLRQERAALDKSEAAELRPVLREAETIRARYASDREPIQEADAELLGRLEQYAELADLHDVAYKRAAATTKRTLWSAEVTDLRALAEAVLDEVVPLRFLQANQQALSAAARTAKSDLNIPGVQARSRVSIGVSAR